MRGRIDSRKKSSYFCLPAPPDGGTYEILSAGVTKFPLKQFLFPNLPVGQSRKDFVALLLTFLTEANTGRVSQG